MFLKKMNDLNWSRFCVQILLYSPKLQVNYIIDYYDVGPVNPENKLFAHLDVRPAVRDWSSLMDRTVAGYWLANRAII